MPATYKHPFIMGDTLRYVQSQVVDQGVATGVELAQHGNPDFAIISSGPYGPICRVTAESLCSMPQTVLEMITHAISMRDRSVQGKLTFPNAPLKISFGNTQIAQVSISYFPTIVESIIFFDHNVAHLADKSLDINCLAEETDTLKSKIQKAMGPDSMESPIDFFGTLRLHYLTHCPYHIALA